LPLLLVGLAAVASLAAAKAPPSGQGGLGWADGKFWSNDSTLEEQAIAPFEDSEMVGLFLDGPRKAPLRQHDSIPLVAIRASSIRDNAVLSLQQRGVLLSTRVEGNETLASLAFRQPNKLRRPTPERDPNTLPEGRAVKLYRLNLGEQIPEVAERSATWATTLLLFNQRSNRVVTRVDAKPIKGSQGPEMRTAKVPPTPTRAADDTTYRVRPDSPALPGGRAIALASASEVQRGPGRSWQLRGSFLLPALARDVAQASSQAPEPAGRKAGETRQKAEAAPTPAATLPVTIVLTGDSDATPILLPLHVPVYQPLVKGKGEQLARGYFGVDLLALLGDQLAPQSYAVWAVSRQQLSEPVVVRLTMR
jgi:hypothetical protein